ncbi:MAG: thermonuclease family protein [Hyphomonadaceae bacterium]|nr:thermonuclease family protein [Hyphomonadaceae bacterium]
MFAWRRKPDGFEWHKYIRTTVKLRREARRERVHVARRAAGQHMNAAGVALAAGSRAAGSAARDGAAAGVGAIGLGLQALWSLLLYGLRAVTRPIIAAVARPNIGGPVILAGAIALGAGIGRSRGVGLDREAVMTLAIGIVLMAALVPMLAPVLSWRLPRLPALWGKAGLMLAGLLVLIAGAAWLASGAGLGHLGSVANLSLIGGGKPVQGRAVALGADTLRVGSVGIKLAGIDAPEGEQRCGARGWRCGAAAEAALSRLVSGRTVKCTLSGSDAAGRTLGQCAIGDKDVGAELVRQGHVFAEGTLLVRYAAQEREARAAKAGLWSAGDAERPAAYRAKVWEEAKRRAPDGCPIKGQVAGASRVYVLPWAADYERVRVQKARGERWFCSEQEAVSAGFKAAQRG